MQSVAEAGMQQHESAVHVKIGFRDKDWSNEIGATECMTGSVGGREVSLAPRPVQHCHAGRFAQVGQSPTCLTTHLHSAVLSAIANGIRGRLVCDLDEVGRYNPVCFVAG